MTGVRYLLDEHIEPTLRAQLVRHEMEMIVWIIGDPGAPPRGMSDPDILLDCQA